MEEGTLDKIPESLRGLNWQRMKLDDPDGPALYIQDRLLVAVPVMHDSRDRSKGWSYQFAVVYLDGDEDECYPTVNGDPWEWELADIEWFVRI